MHTAGALIRARGLHVNPLTRAGQPPHVSGFSRGAIVAQSKPRANYA